MKNALADVYLIALSRSLVVATQMEDLPAAELSPLLTSSNGAAMHIHSPLRPDGTLNREPEENGELNSGLDVTLDDVSVELESLEKALKAKEILPEQLADEGLLSLNQQLVVGGNRDQLGSNDDEFDTSKNMAVNKREQNDNGHANKNIFDYGSAEFALHELEDKLDNDLVHMETILSKLKNVNRKSAKLSKEEITTDQNTAEELQSELNIITEDVNELYATISVTENELHRALDDLTNKEKWINKHVLEEEFTKLIEMMHSDRVRVDYETGQLQTSMGNLNKKEAKQTKNGVARQETVEEHLLELEHNAHSNFAHKMVEKLLKEVNDVKQEEDHAFMQLDLQLLKDIVTLAITAATCGMLAVVLKLPATAGFLAGGMVVGPSCLNLISSVKQVQTLAQFGAIFLLFEQGLLYSRIYSESSPLLENTKMLSLGRAESNDIENIHTEHWLLQNGINHGPNASLVGAVVLALLISSAFSIFWFIEYTSSIEESVILATTVSICSTTVVRDNLHLSNLSDTRWGRQLLQMIAVQDLFMLPLLALPEILESYWLHGLAAFEYVVAPTMFVVISMLISKHIISFAVAINKDQNDELFSLSIVAYALMMATIAEDLGISIEAGAIFAGLVLIKSPYVLRVANSISSLSRVFGGMFLTSLGMIISPEFCLERSFSILKLVALVFFIKIGIVSVTLVRIFKYDKRRSVSAGLSMAQISEAGLVVLARASRLGFIQRSTYLSLVPTTCILLALAPLSGNHFKLLGNGKKLSKNTKYNYIPCGFHIFRRYSRSHISSNSHQKM